MELKRNAFYYVVEDCDEPDEYRSWHTSLDAALRDVNAWNRQRGRCAFRVVPDRDPGPYDPDVRKEWAEFQGFPGETEKEEEQG